MYLNRLPSPWSMPYSWFNSHLSFCSLYCFAYFASLSCLFICFHLLIILAYLRLDFSSLSDKTQPLYCLSLSLFYHIEMCFINLFLWVRHLLTILMGNTWDD